MQIYLCSIIAATALYFTFVSTAHAQSCGTFECNGNVNDFFVYSGGALVRTDLDESTLNCTLDQGVFMTLKKSHANYDAVFSTLLSHYMAGKKIQIRIIENSVGCEVGYVRSFQ